MGWGAVIVAAGRGKRMGTEKNKVLMPLAGRPVLVHTLEAFVKCEWLQEIIVVAAADEVEQVGPLVLRERMGKMVRVVAGGEERQDSVIAGLEALRSDDVLVHDAARPLVSAALIAACRAAAEKVGAATLAVPVKDTIKIAEGGMIVSTPERAKLVAVQTPQAFGRKALLEAHRSARVAGVVATDDAMLFERLGLPVAAVPGQESNLKLTTPEDMILAEMLLQQRRKGADMR